MFTHWASTGSELATDRGPWEGQLFRQALSWGSERQCRGADLGVVVRVEVKSSEPFVGFEWICCMKWVDLFKLLQSFFCWFWVSLAARCTSQIHLCETRKLEIHSTGWMLLSGKRQSSRRKAIEELEELETLAEKCKSLVELDFSRLPSKATKSLVWPA